MDASEGKLTCEVEGEIEKDDSGVLVIRRIRVAFRLEAPEASRETVEKVHGKFARFCPVYRSITPAIEVETGYELVGQAEGPR